MNTLHKNEGTFTQHSGYKSWILQGHGNTFRVVYDVHNGSSPCHVDIRTNNGDWSWVMGKIDVDFTPVTYVASESKMKADSSVWYGLAVKWIANVYKNNP
jgi:hypothetical protein